jgi:lipopolysaccharide transport system ATP-binding protein
MSQIAIKVENLSKIYRIGEIGTGSIGQDVDRWFKTKILGKEDPFLKIGESNDRSTKGMSDFVYSLQDINFEINQGDAVGIIGRNGAGKSTLLKILSRVTTPTTGKINIKGRVASLLEVGTGFHPELTGRENIYLNGAILGMRKREIDRKLDEIIDFSGVERYIDTPVKRYSSGMYVRLAFAVAAHLESEILIVDEVLAVGDAEFQKKCLGKMGEVSKGEGRTVLFVSHNIAAVENLCSKGILLNQGNSVLNSNVHSVLELYRENLKHQIKDVKISQIKERSGNQRVIIHDITVTSLNNDKIYTFDEIEIKLNLKTDFAIRNEKIKIDIGINNNFGDRVGWISTDLIKMEKVDLTQNHLTFTIKSFPYVPGQYSLTLFVEYENEIADWIQNVSPFVINERIYYSSGNFIPSNQGNILLNFSLNEK